MVNPKGKFHEFHRHHQTKKSIKGGVLQNAKTDKTIIAGGLSTSIEQVNETNIAEKNHNNARTHIAEDVNDILFQFKWKDLAYLAYPQTWCVVIISCSY